jgi:nicotinate-nucleotide adenylyltransferase
MRVLRLRFPRVRFVFLLGADNLAQLPRWRGWLRLARLTAFAVLPRPTYTYAALAGQAARRLRGARIPSRAAPFLAQMQPPAWVFLPAREDAHSATALRRAALGG